jgi:hypothetical protein
MTSLLNKSSSPPLHGLKESPVPASSITCLSLYFSFDLDFIVIFLNSSFLFCCFIVRTPYSGPSQNSKQHNHSSKKKRGQECMTRIGFEPTIPRASNLWLLIARPLLLEGEPGSSVGIVSDYGLYNREIEVGSAVEAKGFFL